MTTSGTSDRPTAAPSLGRASAVMAVGTVASRLTGFLRTAAIGAAVGVATSPLADGYNIGNTLPNVAYDLLLGGVLTSVVVPTLARARREDDDDGVAFTQNLLTLSTLVLLVVTVVVELLAPWIVALYNHGHRDGLTVGFARWFLPQLFFYGVGATASAVLNTRNRFALPTVLPVLNNIVVIACAAAYLSMPGDRYAAHRLLVLKVGTTLGVIVMTLPLLPAVRSAGVPWKWRLDLRDPRLKAAGRLGGWTLGYVGITQLGFVVVVNLATSAHKNYSAYSNAYQLFQLPYAVVGVSVVTALLPAMSRYAGAGRIDLLRQSVSRALRLSGGLVVPAAVLLGVLGEPIATLVFQYGHNNSHSTGYVGQTLAILAIGLVPFTIQQLLLRAFYALQDSRTPFTLGLTVTTVLILSDLVAAAVDSGPGRVRGLAVGFDVAYTVGALVTARVLLNRIGGTGRRVLRLYVRVAAAGALAGLITWGVSSVLGAAVPGSGFADALARCLLGGLAGGGSYLILARLMRIREVEPVRALLSRLGRYVGSSEAG